MSSRNEAYVSKAVDMLDKAFSRFTRKNSRDQIMVLDIYSVGVSFLMGLVDMCESSGQMPKAKKIEYRRALLDQITEILDLPLKEKKKDA